MSLANSIRAFNFVQLAEPGTGLSMRDVFEVMVLAVWDVTKEQLVLNSGAGHRQ